MSSCFAATSSLARPRSPLTALKISSKITLRGWQARSWRCYSGGRVCLCQKWASLQTDGFYTNNFLRETWRRRASRPRGRTSAKRSLIHWEFCQSILVTPRMGNTRCIRSGRSNKCTRRCLPRRRRLSNGRWRRSTRRTPMMGNTCHLLRPPFR